MARTFRVLGQEITIGKRLHGIGKVDDYVGEYGISALTNKQFNRLDSYKGTVYACINLIADSYASYQPIISKKQGDELKALPDHELLQLLNNAGGFKDKEQAVPISMFDLLFATAAFIELQGDVYWYIPRGQFTGLPKEIVVLRADKVGKKLIKDGPRAGEIEYFFVTSADGTKTRIDISEMLPFVGFNPRDPYNGIGTTQAAMQFIETDDFSVQFTRNFFKNNAGVSGVLNFVGEWSVGAFRKIVRAWRDKYEGVENAGKIMMVRNSEASFTKLGLGLDELDMSALRKMSEEDIAMMYRVPLPLLGKLTDGTGQGRGNIETLEYIFAKYNIEPKLKRLDNVLQFALERYYQGKEQGLVISHKNIIPEDKEYELNKRDKGVDRWITRNEIRSEDGYDDVEGGDDLRAPLASFPISEDLSTTDETDSTKGTGIFLTVKRKTVVDTTTKSEEAEPVKDENKLNTAHKENFRLSLMKNQVKYERRYKKRFKAVLVQQKAEALNNLEAISASIKALNFQTLEKAQKPFDDAKADQLIEAEVMPVLNSLGEDQGGLALKFAGDDETKFKMTARYESLLRKGTKKMATRYNDETIEALNKTLAEGIQDGENLDKLKSRVEDVYANAEGYRALRVARTETLKASNSASVEAYRQTGYVTGKEWYVNPDSCELCDVFQGKTIGLDDNFLNVGESFNYIDAKGEEQTQENTYDDVEEPPLHPNCRCAILPVR
jgi:HK97 family phage portal protein